MTDGSEEANVGVGAVVMHPDKSSCLVFVDNDSAEGSVINDTITSRESAQFVPAC